ncbi:hypothetical protein SAMN05443572_106171 [Myxococcus fulvus]|uniref:Lipoprotein n=1 Tax=Myxococcus fulvus TaxID=33 RepID=A0A511T2L5_MYXFU|nr:hypothetical protein [Myxococcus fulvus]GEN08404.1 hypothetical protein MFU01_34410 [Myxococcus fulvus]SEU20682.1 hypothetical protein SAMN05443572_106171 [Myxococcus fulvus]
MTRILNGLGLVALLGLILAPVAHADIVDDVWRGTNVRLNAARIHVRGNDYATGYWLLPKSAGTLNLHVPASTFGVNSDLVLNLWGSRSGNVITWTFDDTLPSPYYLGDANSVTRVRGTLKAFARQVRGADDPSCESASCPHNVELVLTGGSQVWVDGYTDIVFKFYWTEPVQVRQFVAYAGVPRPRLAALRVLTSTNRCPSSSATELSGEVVLSSPAPAGGTLVELFSVDASVGVLNVRVPEAQRTARFALRLPPHWGGPTVIQGSSGGMLQSQRVALNRCVTQVFEFTRWRQLPTVSIARLITNEGAVIARLANDESDSLITSKSTVQSLREALGVDRVDVKSVSASGDLFGTAYSYKGPAAVRMKSNEVKAGAQLRVDGYEALVGNAHGTPLVRWPDDKDVVYVVDEVGPAKREALTGLGSERLFFNALGESAAVVQTESGPRAALIAGKERHILLELESDIAALNDVGTVLGTARISGKQSQPFRWTREKGGELLPLPEGALSARALGLNASNWVVGTATAEDKSQLAFITPPDGEKSYPLSQLAPKELEKAGLRIVEALSISDNLEVLVRAVDGDGKSVHLVLSP